MFDNEITIRISESDLRNLRLALKLLKDNENWPFVIRRSAEQTLEKIKDQTKYLDLDIYKLQREEDKWKQILEDSQKYNKE